jgi:hypothetical protein
MSSKKRNNHKINNDRTNFSMNECSLDGRSGIMDATKGVECQALLETNGDTEICQSQTQQPPKKRRMDQTMDRGQTSKVKHETTMAVKENKPFGLLKQQMGVFISAGIFSAMILFFSIITIKAKFDILSVYSLHVYDTLFSIVITQFTHRVYLASFSVQAILGKPEPRQPFSWGLRIKGKSFEPLVVHANSLNTTLCLWELLSHKHVRSISDFFPL